MRWLALILIVACSSSARAPTALRDAAKTPIASNVLRADYAGSPACADCHGPIHAAWEASPMRNMTRDVKTATIHAPFDGATLRVGTDTATMETIGGERVMTHASPGVTTRFRITKVVGGRYREDFMGVDMEKGGPDRVLPATYVFATKSWRYKGYSVMIKERPAMSSRGEWAAECVPCHNTLPLATMLYDELYGPGLPAYQGKLSDRVLPQSKMWSARSLDDTQLTHALGDEIRFLGGTASATELRASLAEAATTSAEKLDGAHLVELGVGCEACHNGAKAHVADPKLVPAFDARSPLVKVEPPKGQAGTRAQWINHTCAKCHTVLFTRYPYTWEGGQRMKNPGGSTTNSGEGRDFQLGGCASQMTCTTCHDPHAADAPAKLAALATPAGNATCTGCHSKYAAQAALEKHSHHAGGSAGTSCVACHMPKKNMGLDYALIRYHRIGSPNDTARVTGDRPLECALCHRDKSVEALVATMEQWWGKHYDRALLERLYGKDLSINALKGALNGLPHEQAVAIAVLGEAKDTSAIKAIAVQLSHPYPLIRFYAQRALQTITGVPVAIDLNQAAADIRPAADAYVTAVTSPSK